MQNCGRKAPDNNNSVKFTSSRGDNSTTNDSLVMKISHAQLHMYKNIMYKFQTSMCKTRRKDPDNNNSVKFTSSRGDNSTTNDSMVMKIAHEQFHMYTNTIYKFQSSKCKTIGEKLQTTIIQ